MFRKKYYYAFITACFLAAIAVQSVQAISPDYLVNGRTYDQDRTYIQWNGSVAYVTIYHKDNTSLPASEGGANCSKGCTETVTRIQSGSSVSGNFTFLQTFSAQVALSGNSAVGTATIRACGTVIYSLDLYVAGAGSPGFNNYPSPAWNVPTSGSCTWSITASGGYVDFRAVTTSYRTSPLPTVNVLINNTQGPVSQTAPGGYTLSWSSTDATACTATGSWSGAKTVSGSQSYANVTAGTYTYTLACTNPAGSASDSVTAYVFAPPSVDVKANNLDGPVALFEPAAFTVTWSSSSASSCQAEGNLTGSIGLNGSQTFNAILQGTYTYTVRCFNPVGSQVVDTVQISVSPLAPAVDLRVDGGNGPITRNSPASYSLSWSSTNASSCSASGNWSGAKTVSGSQGYANVTAGTYIYTLTCTNPSGSASDSVTANVFAPPSVDVKANNLDGPVALFEPAAFTVIWSSSNASSCQAEGNLTGSIGLNGSQTFSNILQGTYTYTVRCFNPTGAQVVDSVQINVSPLIPMVDLRVDGGNGPLTLISPASYTLSWSSQYAASCSASSSDGGWMGSIGLNGNLAFTSMPMGSHTYTITCTNVSGNTNDSVTIYVAAPLSGTITVTYARLVLFASNLGQLAQTLSGTATGGEPPYSITVHVRTPSGGEINLSHSGSTWSVTPQNSGDVNFGTTERGVWTAWAELTDSAGRTYRTTSVIWEVAWHPVHGLP